MSTEAWAKWREVISEQQQGGKSVALFCQERGLRVWQFYEWKKRLRAKSVYFSEKALTKFDVYMARLSMQHSGCVNVRLSNLEENSDPQVLRVMS